MILTRQEMRALTGTSKPDEQIRILRQHGIHPLVDIHGIPKVSWDAVNAMMSGGPQRLNWGAVA